MSSEAAHPALDITHLAAYFAGGVALLGFGLFLALMLGSVLMLRTVGSDVPNEPSLRDVLEVKQVVRSVAPGAL